MKIKEYQIQGTFSNNPNNAWFLIRALSPNEREKAVELFKEYRRLAQAQEEGGLEHRLVAIYEKVMGESNESERSHLKYFSVDFFGEDGWETIHKTHRREEAEKILEKESTKRYFGRITAHFGQTLQVAYNMTIVEEEERYRNVS